MKRKVAILVFPRLPTRSAQYPTGLYKIATACSPEYSVIVIDERLDPQAHDRIAAILSENDVLCLGVSVITGDQITSALDVSGKFHGRTPIVWGGTFPTSVPELVIQCDLVDYVVVGEGETPFLALLRHLDHRGLQDPPFLTKTNRNYGRRFEPNLDSLPHIDFDMYPIPDQYFLSRDGFKRCFNLETSRGCPFRCTFCHNASHPTPYRCISTARVEQFIDFLLRRYTIDGIVFQEDNFFADHRRAEAIVDYLASQQRLGWKANCRVSYVKGWMSQDSFPARLVESGCRVLQLGIESGSERILGMIRKGITVTDVTEVVKYLSSYPIGLRLNFMVGFPGEQLTDIAATLKLMDDVQTINPHVEPPFLNVYTPYPGTPLFDLSVKNGFSPPRTIREWAMFNWNSATAPWIAPEIGKWLARLSGEYQARSLYPK